MGILQGKNILVAGVTMNTSIGYRVVELAQAQGATVVVSHFGRAMSLTGRILKRLDPQPPLIELDVSDDEHLATLADRALTSGINPQPRSGRQEYLENIVNRYV